MILLAVRFPAWNTSSLVVAGCSIKYDSNLSRVLSAMRPPRRETFSKSRSTISFALILTRLFTDCADTYFCRDMLLHLKKTTRFDISATEDMLAMLAKLLANDFTGVRMTLRETPLASLAKSYRATRARLTWTWNENEESIRRIFCARYPDIASFDVFHSCLFPLSLMSIDLVTETAGAVANVLNNWIPARSIAYWANSDHAELLSFCFSIIKKSRYDDSKLSNERSSINYSCSHKLQDREKSLTSSLPSIFPGISKCSPKRKPLHR